MTDYHDDISTNLNRIVIMRLNHPIISSKFNQSAYDAIVKRGYYDLEIDIDVGSGAVFPNAIVPVCASVAELRSKGVDIKINFISGPPNIRDLESPKTFDSTANSDTVFNSVYRFTETDIHPLVGVIIQRASEKIEYSSGSIESIEWILSEIMDNVPQHSKSECGYIMAQFHKDTKRFVVCVSDNGIGIHKNFQSSSKYRPKNADDSLTLSIRHGVTSTDENGRGNGLFGLSASVQNGNGRMRLTSGSRVMEIIGKKPLSFYPYSCYDSHKSGTSVDFQLECTEQLNVGELLGHKIMFSEIKLESMQNDQGEVVFPVSEIGIGYATRTAGQVTANRLVNLINEGARKILIDFESVGVVSSSFADEFIGKVIEKYGPASFMTIFRLANMSASVKNIIDAVIIERLAGIKSR